MGMNLLNGILNMLNKINDLSWQHTLNEEFTKPYFIELQKRIEADKRAGKMVLPFPVSSMVYRALEFTPLWKVKVVILGQDPYPSIQDACGMAFSVPGYRDTPKSLKNMFKELKSDLGIGPVFNDLTHWAVQGVLLLNTVLTVIEGQAGSHKGIGWETFTDEILKNVCKNQKYVVYWLLGKEAQEKEELIINNSKSGRFEIIKLPHPSPLSAHRGFFWSKPYSRTNNFLKAKGLEVIDWRL